MKKFGFPLRSVATLRSMRELRAREAFSLSVHAFARAEVNLAEVRRRIAELREVLLDARRATFRPSDQVAFLGAFENETRAEVEARRLVAAAKTTMDQRRQDWLATRRDVRVVEKLETRARSQHRRECEREEQKALDDLAGSARSALRP